MRIGAELREFVQKAWRDRDPSLSEPESRKLIAEVRGVRLKTVELILRHADGATKEATRGLPKPARPGPQTAPRKTRRRPNARRTRRTRVPPPLTDRESATLLCVAQRLVEGRDDEGSIQLTDRGRHVLAVLERYAP